MQEFADKILKYSFDNPFCLKTKTFYDFAVPGMEGEFEKYLPEPKIIKLNFPNPCGWCTGMEDGCINGGIMLESLMTAYEKTNDKKYISYINDVFEGLKLCATVSKSKGFLARNVSPIDCKTHYINSSRDQYTHWISACCRYCESDLCSKEDKEFIQTKLCEFAERAQKNVTEENNWSLLDENGNQGLVVQMWGSIMPHEAMRLPMMYIVAWKVGGHEQYKDLYMKYRDTAFEKSEEIDFNEVPRPFAVNQMMSSLKLVYTYEDDDNAKKRCLLLMKKLSEYGYKTAISCYKNNFSDENIHLLYHAPKPWNEVHAIPKIGSADYGCVYYMPLLYKGLHKDNPDASWRIRDIADSLSIYTSYPDATIDDEIKNVLKGIAEKFDFSKHYSDAPMYLLEKYWMI